MWRKTCRCTIFILLVCFVSLPASAAEELPSAEGLVQELLELITDTLVDLFEDPQPNLEDEEPEDEAGPILLPGG